MHWKQILDNPRGRLGLWMVIVAVILMVLSFCTTARAEGFGISAMKEVTHDEATYAGFIDYTAPAWSAYVGQWRSDRFGGRTRLAGAEYRRSLGPLFAGIGTAWLDQTTPLNGMQWNFSITIGADLGWADLLCRHISHASMLGIAPDKPNGGWNWCGAHLSF
jgi:hypothetical protein